ncbi:MAG: HEPN domain-containing protein [Planctomycetes bacterium]|nr:HEPN domain-containing protein [Planctomycetota bacterium]MBU4400549.1 HEPN domain-containing protein [Planctomycetota bacterium]MCG2682711.1 HEPN domain-containing protein [Planctomycetales bacterium]
MDEAKSDYIRQWLRKAQIDLESARRLAGPADPFLDTAFFHCQQAAEKSVKGYLAFCDHPWVNTHNVKTLVRLAVTYESRFSQWKQAAERLTPYATDFRYPIEGPEIIEPDEEQYQQAEQAAVGIFDFVCSLLPDEARPPEPRNSQ